jgi:putative FmdB family regulatory protein
MPLYEYECSKHGLFDETRVMLRSREPAACPHCQTLAPRVLSITRTSLVPRATSVARARNERSQHAPEVRNHAHPLGPAKGAARHPRGFQKSHGKRPWVLEHG